MRCVQCGSLKDKVLDSRSSKDGTTIRRRRECLQCTYRYTTYEQIERTELRVVKRDGTREPVSFDKVLQRIRGSARGLAVNADVLAQQVLADEAGRAGEQYGGHDGAVSTGAHGLAARHATILGHSAAPQ